MQCILLSILIDFNMIFYGCVDIILSGGTHQMKGKFSPWIFDATRRNLRQHFSSDNINELQSTANYINYIPFSGLTL